MINGGCLNGASVWRLSEVEAKQLVASYGVKTPLGRVVMLDRFSIESVSGLVPPLAVKLLSRDVNHKTEINGVRLGVMDTAGIRDAVMSIAKSARAAGVSPEAVLVEEMASPGTEILVGGVVDPVFGPAIVMGLGGIYTEIFDDVQARICPIDEDDVDEMLRALRSFPLLAGARGRTAGDVQALIKVALAIGGPRGLLLQDASVKEVDLNPVIVGSHGAVAVDARVIKTSVVRAGDAGMHGTESEFGDAVAKFRPLFMPKTIAIVGASNTGRTRANDVLDFTRAMGFDGPIYPIHPKAEEIAGLKAYRSFADCPSEVDYAFVAIAADNVPDLINSAAGRVRFAQIMASGFGETADGQERGIELLRAARENHVRLIGPNCLGTYSPRGKLTYIRDCPEEPGPVGIISQSGGLSTDMLRRGVQRGLRYSAVVSAGNCLDVGPSELLAYFQDDAGTGCIGLYLESLTDGRRFFNTLLSSKTHKPVVILKGGRTPTGQRVALSHTGALAGDDRLWDALSRQTGVLLVSTIDEFLDVLLAFQSLRPSFKKASSGAFLFGNGGGASVLGTDAMSRLGVALKAPKDQTVRALRQLDLAPGTSISNPIDMPSGAMRAHEGLIARSVLEVLVQMEKPDAILYHINMPQFLTNPSIPNTVFDNLVGSAVDIARSSDMTPIFLVLRSDGSAEIDERKRKARARAIASGLPVFDEIPNAIAAIAHFQRFERFHFRRLSKDRMSSRQAQFGEVGTVSSLTN